MNRHGFVRTLSLATVMCCSQLPARAGDAELLSRLPHGANAIVIIDVEQILSSPMGVKGHWKENLKNAYAEKPLIVPPNASRLALASMINPSTMQPEWEVSVMELRTTPSMKKIARAEDGFQETIADKQAVWSPIDAYFLRLDSRMIGTVAPANRQFAARWARDGGSQAANLTPYIQQAAGLMDAKTSYLFAMDLQDAASPDKIRRRIEMGDFDYLADEKVDAEEIASVFAGIRGVTLRVSIGDEAVGSGVVEFAGSTAPLKDFAKPMILQALGGFGAAIEGLDTWKVAVKGNSITLSGKLPTEGLRQLFSIVDPPSPLPTDDSDDDESETSKTAQASDKSDAAVVAASKSYYAAITKITENVGKKIRGSTAPTEGAKWVAADARRIGRLPIMNVDPDLVAWGTDVTMQLNELASAVGIGGFQVRSRAVGIQDAYVSGTHSSELEIRSDPNDRIAKQNVRRQRLAASAEQRAQTSQIATKIMMEIEASRAQIRTAMVQRYNVEF